MNSGEAVECIVKIIIKLINNNKVVFYIQQHQCVSALCTFPNSVKKNPGILLRWDYCAAHKSLDALYNNKLVELALKQLFSSNLNTKVPTINILYPDANLTLNVYRFEYMQF